MRQVELGLSQISSVVQNNAATAEENSATSQEMSAQAAKFAASSSYLLFLNHNFFDF